MSEPPNNPQPMPDASSLNGAGSVPAGRGGTSQNPALARAALRSRVRTITDGAVELDPVSPDGGGGSGSGSSAPASVLGAVIDGRAFFQTDDHRGLGPAVRWARSNGAAELTLIAEADVAPDLARRASLLDAEISVWSATGPEVVPAVAVPVGLPPELPADELRFGAVISEAGARPLDDHGMLVAEVAGLEVARVIDEETALADGLRAGDHPGPRLVVGVGQADRELQQYLHGHLDDDTNLRRAIAAVVRHRRPGSAAHPLTRVARQRWLRSILLDDPSLIGLADLEPVTPLRPRTTVLGDEPTAAAGSGAVVVCSVGVDLDLLPEAVDYRQRVDPGAELVVVVPERDRRLATSSMAELVPNLRVVSIPAPWDA